MPNEEEFGGALARVGKLETRVTAMGTAFKGVKADDLEGWCKATRVSLAEIAGQIVVQARQTVSVEELDAVTGQMKALAETMLADPDEHTAGPKVRLELAKQAIADAETQVARIENNLALTEAVSGGPNKETREAALAQACDASEEHILAVTTLRQAQLGLAGLRDELDAAARLEKSRIAVYNGLKEQLRLLAARITVLEGNDE